MVSPAHPLSRPPIEDLPIDPTQPRGDSRYSSTILDAICRLNRDPPSIAGRVEDLTSKSDPRFFEDNPKLLEEFFKKNELPAEAILELSKLSGPELKLLLIWLQCVDLWFFVNYVCEYLQADADINFARSTENFLSKRIRKESECKEHIKKSH